MTKEGIGSHYYASIVCMSTSWCHLSLGDRLMQRLERHPHAACPQLVIYIIQYGLRSVYNRFIFFQCRHENNNVVIVAVIIFVNIIIYYTELSRHMLIIASHPKRWPTLLCRVVYLYLHSTTAAKGAPVTSHCKLLRADDSECYTG